MKKRIIALALCLVMLLGCLGMGVDALTDTAPLYDRLIAAQTAEEFDAIAESATEEELSALTEDQFNDIEQHYASLIPESDHGSGSNESGGIHCVNFTNVAPLVQANTSNAPARKMLARDAKTVTDNPGVETRKTVKANNNGTYTLRLETYVTGATTTTETAKPTDIVLVLDVSGSMSDELSPYKYNKVTADEVNENMEETYFYYYTRQGWYDPYSSGYYQLYWCSYCKAWVATSRAHKLDNSHQFRDKLNPDSTQFYTREEVERTTKMDALKVAANNFIDSVAARNSDDNIAVIKFAGNKENTVGNDSYWESGYSYNYSQIVRELTKVSENAASLKGSINEITAGGATSADYGMQHAQTIINKIDSGRDSNKVIIFFTDGEPNHHSGFDTTVAKSTIEASKALKDEGCTVYTIGILDGADPTLDINEDSIWKDRDYERQINKYMHYVSSNYPSATDMSNGGQLDSKANPFNNGKSYYLTAVDAKALDDIFQNISEEVGGASIKLDSNTVVKDVISDYFKLPEGTDESKIVVKTADCNAFNGDTPVWTNEQTVALNPAIDGKTVTVKGFDFSENWVGKNKTDNTVHAGKKLIIEIPIVPEDSFLGGNNVPTNADTSGVYDGEGTLVENYEVPTANVPINLPALEAKNANVYYGGNVPGSSDLYKAYTIADKMGDFVNITYTLDKTVSNTADGTYTITATAEPKYDGYGAEGTPATAKTATATANVYVFKPEITYRDSAIDLGQTPNYEKNLAKVEWKHDDKVADPSEMIGNAPTLSYEYNSAADSAEAFKTDTYVNVTVKIGDKDITEAAVTFKHAECDYNNCNFNASEGQFIVHIKTFDLTITKSINRNESKLYGSQDFVFNVKSGDGKTDIDVVVNVPDGATTGSVTIKGLPVGKYVITEDTGWSWRYQLEGAAAASGTAGEVVFDKNSHSATYTPDGVQNEIVFTNNWVEAKWLSFTDSVKNFFGMK